MKKTNFITVATLCASTVLSLTALSGCGASEEERFAKAKENFVNYTVAVDLVCGDEECHSELKIADKAGMLVVTYENTVETTYYKEENGKVYYYAGKSNGWLESGGKTIENTMDEEVGFIGLFQNIFYDDFEKDSNYLKMKESAISSYNKGYDGTLCSVKLLLQNEIFTSAVMILEFDGSRFEYRYTFTDYGKTKVELPVA